MGLGIIFLKKLKLKRIKNNPINYKTLTMAIIKIIINLARKIYFKQMKLKLILIISSKCSTKAAKTRMASSTDFRTDQANQTLIVAETKWAV